jgi:X-X-X-Leu-X-X-Gly heptad repeat protein
MSTEHNMTGVTVEGVPGMMPLLPQPYTSAPTPRHRKTSLSFCTVLRAGNLCGAATSSRQKREAQHTVAWATRALTHAALALLLVASFVPLAGWAISDASLAEAEDANQAQAPTTTEKPSPDATAGSGAAGGTTAAGAASINEKDEVIYALLDEDGAPYSGYVINHFQVDSAGTLTDLGAYNSATNLSTIAPLTLKNQEVSVAVEQGDFYYEGVLNTVTLPWLVDISYTLDGASVAPEQLAGASGQLEIRIKTRQNTALDPLFFKNYLLQVQLTLNAGTTRNLNAPDATIATAGTNQQVAFMVLPGKDGDLRLTAQVSDFEMPGIQISGLPFSMVFEVPNTSEMVDDMATLADAIAALDEGVGKLQSGVADMRTGATDLASGSADLNEGLSLLSENSTELTLASAQVDVALAEIVKRLEGGAVDPSQVAKLVDGLRTLAETLYNSDPAKPDLAEGLTQAQNNITDATLLMDSYIEALAPVDQTAIDGLLGDQELASLQGSSQTTILGLIATNEQAAYVRGAWYGQSGNNGVKAGFTAIATGLGQTIGSCQYLKGQLDLIATELEKGLSGLAELPLLTSSLKKLSGNFSTFNKGVVAYTEGVDAIASNYKTFNSGLTQFARGVGELYGGVASLHGGTSELYANVEDLPETVQEQIDSFLADYQKSDFKPVSFTAPDNEHIERVQFVLITDPIKVPAPEKEHTEVPVEQSFWDRLKALFE